MEGDQNLNELLLSLYISPSFQAQHLESLLGTVNHNESRIFESILTQLGARRNSKTNSILIRYLSLWLESNSSSQSALILYNQLVGYLKSLGHVVSTVSKSKNVWPYVKLVSKFPWKNLENESKKSLIEAHSALCLFVSPHLALYKKNYTFLKKYLAQLDQQDLENYHTLLAELASNSSNLAFVLLWSGLLKFDRQTNNLAHIKSYKSNVIDLFSRVVILSKSKLTNSLCSFSFQGLLNEIEPNEFQSSVFPALQKSILRNAEVSLSLVAFFMQHMSFDLSFISQDLSKILGTHLHSKEESLQADSLVAVSVYATKCFNADAIKSMFAHFVKVYNGSEGKITIVSQKASLLKAIGNLAVSGLVEANSRKTLYDYAIEEILKLVKQETNESSLVLILAQLKQWISSLAQVEISSQFWKSIKELRKSKVATPVVMASLYDTMVLLFSSPCPELNSKHVFMLEDDFLSSILLSAKNATLPAHKTLLVNESMYSFLILLHLNNFDKELGPKLKGFTSILSDFNQITFLSEKYVKEATHEIVTTLIELIGQVFKTIDVNTENSKVLYRALILAMCHQWNEKPSKLYSILDDLCSTNGRKLVSLIQAFTELFGDENNAQHSTHQIKCFHHLSSRCTSHSLQIETLILEVMKACHIPFLYDSHSRFFVRFIKKCLGGDKVKLFVEKNSHKLVDVVLNSECGNGTKANIVKSLVKLEPHIITNLLYIKILISIDEDANELKTISKNDYEIYLTPPGTLFNRSLVLDAADNLDGKNLKRESKLYSYKEQMAELELRKELEKKEKKDVLDVNKMNKKQKEIYKQEMAKEEVIRKHLQQLEQKLSFNTHLLLAVFETNQIVASIYLKDLTFAYVNLLSSRLAFKVVSGFYLKISQAMMISPLTSNDKDYFKMVATIANTTVRLYSESGAPSEELCQLVHKLITYLHHRTCPNTDNYDEKLIRLTSENRLTTPAFTYIFPFLRYVCLNMKKLPNHDSVVEKCLQIISQHSLLRLSSTDLEDLKNPQHFPIRMVIDTLIQLMTEMSIPTGDKLAAGALVSVVRCVNGEPGCGKASTTNLTTLLNSTTHSNDLVRVTCFESLQILSRNILSCTEDSAFKEKLKYRSYVGMFDSVQECQLFAKQIFELCHFKPSVDMINSAMEDLEKINLPLVVPISLAFKSLIEEFPQNLDSSFVQLIDFYKKKALESIPVVDAFGRSLTKEHQDKYEPRLAVGHIFKNIAKYLSKDQFSLFMNLLIPDALSDNDVSVRSVMLEAGCQLIDFHGEDNVNYFLDVFESFLDTAADGHQNDLVRKSVIILMGTLAKHISSDNPKLKPILSKLVEALSTPSQIVQEAVANCLQHLIPKFKDDAPALLQKLLEFLFESEIYGERKGAAYGIAGIIKGLGILSLNKLGIMDALTQAIQAKDKPNNREGALFAFEMLSSMLGRLFEPYIVHILPYLLDCFGDSSTRVRQAADDTAKVIMSKLSAPGVTLIYPAILAALEDDSWRKKVSSIELLGSMAYCAPKQLSQCLPKIVPKLMGVVTDSHSKVQKAAAQALEQIGKVIKNPEIQEVVPILLEALQDPANKTNKCLNTMLNMKFVHVIDPPSLALIMPVIERAFQNRSTETRKMASQIIGNMYALTKSKDLSPYLPSIVPGLKNSLLDPVPEVRGVTARALGAMVKSLGDEILSELLPWLKEMLVSEASSVDRSGAAQGLAEVLGGLGSDSLDTFMPEIIAITERQDVPSHVKDGYIMLYIYLPLVFTQRFANYISQVINPILKALADENEFVRETALRAGQRIVTMYAESAIQLLLPELERGLFDENWRIRFSSVQLLGDLLFKIIGVSGKMTTESIHEDDNFGTEQSHQAIFEALGEERRNHILTGLYMCRSDVSLQVRQASLHVWKVVVTNTPRTLKEILPVLFSIILRCLASNSSDLQQNAARTLGDLVRKLGERILPEIIPILEEGLESDRADQRQGVCIGLGEIIASTSREMVQAFADSLIPTVKRALFDSLPEVRQAAARTFDHLYSAIGNKAIDDIVTNLLENLDNPDIGERTLDSLKNIIAFKSKIVLPYLIPKLTADPVNTRALAFISSVAGDSLTKHLTKIIPPLLSALTSSYDTEQYDQQLFYCQSVLVSITDELGARMIILSLLDQFNSTNNMANRRVVVSLLSNYCASSKPAMVENFLPRLLRGLIQMISIDDEVINNQSTEALNSIVKGLSLREQLDIVPEVSNALRQTLSDFQHVDDDFTSTSASVPGFKNNKGILPFTNLFKEGLLTSGSDLRLASVEGFRYLACHASFDALKPSIMSITGTILRVLSERLLPEIRKVAIDTLSILLCKLGLVLKPFIPQIQTIFFRALCESNRELRLQASICISRLSKVQPRIELFFTELLSLIESITAENDSFKETAYRALRLSIFSAGNKVSPAIHRKIVDITSEEHNSADEMARVSAATCIGVLCGSASPELLDELARRFLFADSDRNPIQQRQFCSVVLKIALKDYYQHLLQHNENWNLQILKIVLGYITSSKLTLALDGIKCSAYIFYHSLRNNIEIDSNLIHAYAKTMNHENNDIKHAMAEATIYWSYEWSQIPEAVFRSIVPMLVNGTKEKNTKVRSESESALIHLLKLKQANSPVLQNCISALSSGAAESLEDCVAKITKKNLSKYDFKLASFDDTFFP